MEKSELTYEGQTIQHGTKSMLTLFALIKKWRGNQAKSQRQGMVPRAGIEPARHFCRGILSPLCLPISPPGLSVYAVCSDANGVIRNLKSFEKNLSGTKSGSNTLLLPAAQTASRCDLSLHCIRIQKTIWNDWGH